jgi:3,4-dihydroxy 2-butanone 4-phosphate synthase/GTP cyclohydrolase II
MTKRDRMGHDLIGLDDFEEAHTMDGYDEAVYLLGDRRPAGDPRDSGGAR